MQQDDHKHATCAVEYKNELEITGSRLMVWRHVLTFIKEYVRGPVSLDYGCGPGKYTLLLKEYGLIVDAVDINEEIINIAKESDPEGNYKVIRSAEIPAVDNYYDFVFCCYVFPYVSSKKEILAIMQEIYRCLKIEGIFMVVVMNEHFYRNNFLSTTSIIGKDAILHSGCMTKFLSNTGGVVVYNYFWSYEDYKELIPKAGFELVCVHDLFGKDSDGVEYKSEKEKPYSTIYIARKVTDSTVINF